ncbi:type II toxin-antitoxin system RelE/ParE family toxin [Pelatocladus sp. BLCC-F211]|uniref:type II toxin-antitoxin system RelE family toxin n=1 Tax=Pelatocladus sp. BLCC-F211 TaxID=3342752 RepID=UPI0035B7F3ED
MIYEVKLTKRAKKMFRKLPQDLQDRIQPKIDELALEPRPDGVKKLKGKENSYRISHSTSPYNQKPKSSRVYQLPK